MKTRITRTPFCQCAAAKNNERRHAIEVLGSLPSSKATTLLLCAHRSEERHHYMNANILRSIWSICASVNFSTWIMLYQLVPVAARWAAGNVVSTAHQSHHAVVRNARASLQDTPQMWMRHQPHVCRNSKTPTPEVFAAVFEAPAIGAHIARIGSDRPERHRSHAAVGTDHRPCASRSDNCRLL